LEKVSCARIECPVIELQGRQTQRPSQITNESDQRSARTLASSVVIDANLINIQIRVGPVEFVFSASHYRAVDVADNLAAYLRHGDDAVRILNECCQFLCRK